MQMETAQSGLVDLTSKKSKRLRDGSGGRLHIQCQQKGNGQKFLNIYVSMPTLHVSKYRYLGNILVPQGAYRFVAAMDEVIRQLPGEEPTHREGDDESPLILGSQSVEGARQYNFKLSAWHKKGYQWNFNIQSVPTSVKHKEWTVFFPFSSLSWLRHQMVTMLEEHDGSERIYEMPIIPEWAKRNAPNIEQQGNEQEQVTDEEKEADDEDWPCSSDYEDWPRCYSDYDYEDWPCCGSKAKNKRTFW